MTAAYAPGRRSVLLPGVFLSDRSFFREENTGKINQKKIIYFEMKKVLIFF